MSEKAKECLTWAQEYADKNSRCKKVAVGSMIVPKGKKITILGTNITYPISCKSFGCRRVDLYGEDSKNHRLPSDCRSLHSEIDAITQAAKFGLSLEGATIYVTRYPCEACARAIVNSGIKKVYYGREQVISEETKAIFNSMGVTVQQVKGWTYDDTER